MNTRITASRLLGAPIAFACLCAMFFGLGSSVAAANQENDQSVAIQQESLPEARVGDLSFKVTSLRVSENKKMFFNSWATISMTITNNGKVPVALNYVWDKTKLVNARGYVWRDSNDRPVLGLPVADAYKAGIAPIEPGGEVNVTIPLFYENSNPGKTAGNSFDLGLEFESYQVAAEGKVTKLRTYTVSFAGLHSSPAQASEKPETSADNASTGNSSLKAEPIPEARVGDLVFKVNALRVSKESRLTGFASNATISMTITNVGETPIALDYAAGKVSFVNEIGQYWDDRFVDHAMTGLPTAKARSAGINVVIKPGSEVQATLKLFYETLIDTHEIGDNFNFEVEFESYRDMGEGEVRKVRTYPVSFLGLHQSSMQVAAKQGMQDFGNALKKSFGSMFGQ